MYMLRGTSQYHCQGQSVVEALVVVQKMCRTEVSFVRAILPPLLSLLVYKVTPHMLLPHNTRAGLLPLMYTLEEVSMSS